MGLLARRGGKDRFEDDGVGGRGAVDVDGRGIAAGEETQWGSGGGLAEGGGDRGTGWTCHALGKVSIILN